ncbi:MAG: cytochrome c-type biogenesis protein [Pseudomonadota bacterium]
MCEASRKSAWMLVGWLGWLLVWSSWGLLQASWTQAAPASAPVAWQAQVDERVTHLTEQLRCLVCQNQTIADSHADLALDLKRQVHEKLVQGWSDEQVIDYMVQRYGDFVLYRPPVKWQTWALWFGPFVLLLLGLAVLWRRLTARRLFRDSVQDTADASGFQAVRLQQAEALLGDTALQDVELKR